MVSIIHLSSLELHKDHTVECHCYLATEAPNKKHRLIVHSQDDQTQVEDIPTGVLPWQRSQVDEHHVFLRKNIPHSPLA